MRVACVQFQPLRTAVTANVDRMIAFWPDGCVLTVFPELATTGYLFLSPDEIRVYAEPADGPSLSRLIQAAAAKNAYAVVGFAEAKNGRIYNSAALVGPHGVIDVYRKVHLFDRELSVFSPGREAWRVHDVGGLRVGMMICFDWLFPEAARALALAGAELIAHPSNLVLPYCQDAMITRCLENRVYAATANRVGEETDGETSLHFTGKSQIVSPKGERLAQAGAEEDAVVVAEIDPSLAYDKRATPSNHIFAQRVPHLYHALTDDIVPLRSEKPYRLNVAAIVVDRLGRILAGERSDLPGVWQLPQGGIDPGESEEEALRRELAEEIGVAAEEIEIVARSNEVRTYSFPAYLRRMRIAQEWSGQAQRYFVVRLKKGAEPAVEASDGEFCAFRWLAAEELLAQAVHFKRAAYAAAFSEFAHLLRPDPLSDDA